VRRFGPLLVLGFATVCRLSRAAPVVETDICVYGGTSGGVAAANASPAVRKREAVYAHSWYNNIVADIFN